MYELFIKTRNSIIGFCYRAIIKRIFFMMDPEDVHQQSIKTGKIIAKTATGRAFLKILFNYQNTMLVQQYHNITFKTPLGLAAGFDKDAELTQVMPCLSFGFEEAGSITGEPCQGNPRPRLWRLKDSKALLVYYGLKNKGCEEISGQLKNKTFAFPLGISVAKTNCAATVPTQAGIYDYVKALKTFHEKSIGDYYTINISCPNSFGGQPFTEEKKLEQLLKAVDKMSIQKPLWIKLSPDIDSQTLDKLMNIALKFNVTGFISSNLTKNSKKAKLRNEDQKMFKNMNKGGVSGKAVEDLSNAQIQQIYKKIEAYKKQKKVKKDIMVIGCGGIFTAEDAYQKIKAGASLLQMITGMIYQGPSAISEINQGLVELLKREGYNNISEAVGKDAYKEKI